MQKMRLQIMLDFNELNLLKVYQRDNNCKNESTAIGNLLVAYNRLQAVIAALEKRAHEADGWKKKAETPGGIPMKGTIAKNAKISTDSKVKSVENIKDTRKQGGES